MFLIQRLVCNICLFQILIYRILYFRGLHVTFRSLDPSSQMKETFCLDCKGDSIQRLMFLEYIIREIPWKLQLNWTQIRTSHKPIKNTLKSKMENSIWQHRQKPFPSLTQCCLDPTHFHWIVVVLLKNSSRTLNCFFSFSWREGNLDNPFNIYTCIYQQLHNFKA